MTPDRQALERAARAYLAACDVESIDSETWYRAVVDARDALRAALARETPTPPTPAEGRGEEARIDALAKVLADANADYVEPRVGEEGKRYGVDLPENFCEMYRYMASRAIRSLPHGDGGEEAVVTAAIRDVLAERAKQRRKWGDSHDDDHKHGELTIAAAELAVAGTDARVDNAADGPDPWGLVRKNPNRRDQLVIAAALLLAEIERKDRAIRSLPHGDGGGKGAK